jgi:hypothetical protein
MALITATARLNVSAKTPATVCPRAARQVRSFDDARRSFVV